jgi:acetyl/propionyl-CoA carboxylase alpha subunit
MGEAAVRIGKKIGYTNAGTIEFLVDKNLNFYFLEMNTRIQVEHPVTEMVTGIDLVEEQIRIAEGHPLRLKQEDLIQTGHAIECRIYAEDPEHNFMPSPGKMSLYREPEMDHIRIDKGITAETEILSSYDPMISKLVAWGTNRQEATIRMSAALNEYVIHGIHTNIPYLSALLNSKTFVSNSISTKFCDEHTPAIIAGILKERNLIPVHFPLIAFLIISLEIRNGEGMTKTDVAGIWNAIGFWREQKIITVKAGADEYKVEIPGSDDTEYKFAIGDKIFRSRKISGEASMLTFQLDGEDHTVYFSSDTDHRGFVSFRGHTFEFQRLDFLPESVYPVRLESSGHSNEIHSPMPGKVTKVFVNAGQKVIKGDVLLIIEAMKMENSIYSPSDGFVEQVNVVLGDRVDPGKVLIILEKNEISDNK